MKNFRLFLAFVVCSTVVVASETPAPVADNAQVTQASVVPTLLETIKGYANTAYANTVGKIDEADAYVVNFANENVVAPFKKNTEFVTTPVVNFANEVYAKCAQGANCVKDFTVSAVEYPFGHPLRSVIVAAAAYATYYAYNQYNSTSAKKTKNN